MHDRSAHVWSSAQPHFYRPATPQEERDPTVKLYRGKNHGEVLRRVAVTNAAEVVVVFCQTCADQKATLQVVCFQRTLAVGEIIGTESKGGRNES